MCPFLSRKLYIKDFEFIIIIASLKFLKESSSGRLIPATVPREAKPPNWDEMLDESLGKVTNAVDVYKFGKLNEYIIDEIENKDVKKIMNNLLAHATLYISNIDKELM